MKSTGPADLRAVGDPIAAELLPGWRVAWEWCTPEAIGGALAMIYPDPKREIARIMVAPHPEDEDITESLAHEIVHGTISPLVNLIKPSAEEVAIEEPIVERIGVLIARLWKAAQGLARASLRRGVATYDPAGGVRFRARISAPRRTRRNGGGMVDYKLLAQLALEGGALIAAEGMPPEAAAWIKKAVEAMAGAAAEPDGDENPIPGQRDPNKPGEGAPPGPGEGGGGDGTMRLRGRTALAEIEAIAADSRARAKDGLIDLVRARIPSDHKGLPALEKKIRGAADYAAAKTIADLALDMFPEAPAGNGKARGTDDRQSADKPAGGEEDTTPDPEDLKVFDAGFQAEYRRLRKGDKGAAEHWIRMGRQRLERDKAQGRP